MTKTRVLSSLGLLAIILGVTPTRAASLPRLAGVTTLTTTIGPAATLATLPKAVRVSVASPGSWVKLGTLGEYGGVMLDDVGRRGTARTGLFYARLAAPAGCSLEGRCTPVESVAVRVPGSATYVRPTSSTLTLPAGTYRVYAFGAYTGRSQTVRLSLPGLGGSTTIRAATGVAAGISAYSRYGLNDGAAPAHPENVLGNSSFADESWLNYGGYPVAVSGGGTSNWGVKARTFLAGGVWSSPASGRLPDAARPPAALTSCWEISAKSAPLPDYWWMHPAENHHYFTGPYTPKCVHQANAGVDRSFALVLREASAMFQYRSGSPVIAPSQRTGWFAFSVSLLDTQ